MPGQGWCALTRSAYRGPSQVLVEVAMGGEDDRQSGDGQVGGPYSSPGQPGNPVPEPDDTDDED